MLQDLCLPEFSPSQKMPGPLRVKVFKNNDSNYDLIIGMDAMQILGIDVSCSSKAIAWNGNKSTFKLADYF